MLPWWAPVAAATGITRKTIGATGNVGIGTTLSVGPDESTLPPAIQEYPGSGQVFITNSNPSNTGLSIENAVNNPGLYVVSLNASANSGIEGDNVATMPDLTEIYGICGVGRIQAGGGGSQIIGVGGESLIQTDAANEGIALQALSSAYVFGGATTTVIGLDVQDQTGATNNYAIKTSLGKVWFGDVVQIATSTFSALPQCNPGEEGTQHPVTDSATSTLGATISTGGGSSHVLAYCDKTNWTVMAK